MIAGLNIGRPKTDTSHFKMEGDLPHNLLVTIFSSLPLRDLFRARAVCKLWNEVIASHELWAASTHNFWVLSEVGYRKEEIIRSSSSSDGDDNSDEDDEQEPVEAGITPSSSSDGDDNSNEDDDEEPVEAGITQWLELWHLFSGSRIRLLRGGFPHFCPPFCLDAIPSFKILASAGGLVCGAFQVPQGDFVYWYSFLRCGLAVGNPFTRTWRVLPPVHDPPRIPVDMEPCALMWVDCHLPPGARSSYKLALFPTNANYSPLSRECQAKFWMLVYDSNFDHWEHAPDFTWSCLCGDLSSTLPLSWQVPILFDSYYDNSEIKRLGIGVYNVASRSWHAAVEVAYPAELDGRRWTYMAYRAFLYKERCILIAVCVKCASNILVCTAFDLDREGKALDVLSRSSARIRGQWRLYAFVQRRLLDWPFRLEMEGQFLVIYPWVSEEVWSLVAFNMELSTWTLMQKHHPNFSYVGSCSLSPNLAAVP